jgi:hypothetical protein
MTTTESHITSGKAESTIDTPDFAQMIRTIWLTASTSLAEDRLIEAVEEIKLYGLQQYVAGKRDMHETDVALMSTLSERVQQAEAVREKDKEEARLEGRRDMREEYVQLTNQISEMIERSTKANAKIAKLIQQAVELEADRDHWKAKAEAVKEALEIGRDAAHEVAERCHQEFAGYKEHRHKAVDADVATIDAAIALLSPAQQEPSGEK